MPWDDIGWIAIIEGVGFIVLLIYYRNRPKPKWLSRDIAIAMAVARFLHIMKMVRAKVRI